MSDFICPSCHTDYGPSGYVTANWTDQNGNVRPEPMLMMKQGADYCRRCYYGGVPLERNLAGVIDVLTVATGTEWHAEHTGGGCMVLATYFGPRVEKTYEPWGVHPGGTYFDEGWRITLGNADDGPLYADTTVDSVERWCPLVSMNDDQWMGEIDYDDWQNQAVGLEQLPHTVRDLAERIRTIIAAG